MSAKIDRWWLWVAANLIGIALFLHLAAKTWIEPELANEPGASGGGEAIVWFFSAFPVFLFFMLAHFASGLVAHRQRAQSGRWRGELLVSCTLLFWLAAFFIDNDHHGI